MKKRDMKKDKPEEKSQENSQEEVKGKAESKAEEDEERVKEKTKPKPKTIEEKYQDSLKEIDELKKKRMYLQAEMENSQKIALKRIENNKFNIKVSVISNFLPMVDSFEAAISKYESTSKQDYHQLLEGLKSLQKQYLQVLKTLDVKPIEKINIPFNYKEHDVFMKMVDEDHPEDTVIKIAQKGYYLGENVLRPAKVIVSKKKDKPKAVPVEAEVVDIKDIATEQKEAGEKEKVERPTPDNQNSSNSSGTDYIS